MEKERKIKVLSLVALVVAVLGLTVAFAALSQTLTINGTANVDAASWDIHFENLSDINIHSTGNTVIENNPPTLYENTIENINVSISTPGDYLDYMVDVVNDGSIDAKVSSVDISPLCTLDSPVESCDWDNNGIVSQEDVNLVNQNIMFAYGFSSEDGSSAVNTIPKEILEPGNRIQLGIFLSFNNNANELPKRNLEFKNLSVTINYVQA